ncbi:MAG: hypothetical protein J0L92_26280 [Deltaproteobacteria bacterium]|nr:hypothetical protein [Deltaproteobacteria bacterium]
MVSSIQNAVAVVSNLTSPARIKSPHCTPLAARLRAVAPTDLSPDQREALAVVGRIADEVDAITKDRMRTAPPALRGPRNNAVTSWSSMNAALLAIATVPGDVDADGPEAAAIALKLFPQGITFTQDDAHAVWRSGHVLISRITEEGLEARLDALVPALRASVMHTHTQLGSALGVDGSVGAVPTTRSLADAVSRFAFAVSSYARALSVGLDPQNEVAMERFEKALGPIEDFRVTGKSDGDDEADEGPPPVFPPGTPPPFVS